MFIVSAIHRGVAREFGPFPTEREARDWIIRHGENIAHARVQRRDAKPPRHDYAGITYAEKLRMIPGIMAEVARLEAEDDNPESPF